MARSNKGAWTKDKNKIANKRAPSQTRDVESEGKNTQNNEGITNRNEHSLVNGKEITSYKQDSF